MEEQGKKDVRFKRIFGTHESEEKAEVDAMEERAKELRADLEKSGDKLQALKPTTKQNPAATTRCDRCGETLAEGASRGCIIATMQMQGMSAEVATKHVDDYEASRRRR